MRPRNPGTGNIRPLSDEEWWNKFCEPLVKYLIFWRTWAEISRWRIAHKIKEAAVTNGLAYLFLNKKARYHVKTKQWGPMTGDYPTKIVSSEDIIDPKATTRRTAGRRRKSRTSTPETVLP